MKRFLLKVGILVILLISLFYTLEQLITQGLKKSTSSIFIDWNRIYQGSIQADLIINGSSKAFVHISPKILDSILQLSSYNLGIDGHDFYMQHCKYSTYEHYNKKPKLILQVISHSTLNKREDLFEIEQFLPYLDDSIMQQTTKDYIGLNNFDYWLPFVRYFGHRNIIKEGLLSYFNFPIDQGRYKYKGYAPNDFKWDNSFERFVKYFPKGKTIELSDVSIQKFRQFIEQQKNKNIPVVLVYPPTYYPSQQYINNRAEIMALYQTIAEEYQLLLLDYSQLPLTKEKTFFYNSQHLNQQGSEIFSQQLAKDLQKHFDLF